jgi:hypothetical protein
VTIDTQTLSIAMSIASWLGLLLFIVRGSMRLGALELKVDTMWGFQMRRSMSEVIGNGLGHYNSPLVLEPEAIARLDSIKPQIRQWYNNYPANLKQSDVNVMLAIEHAFGDKLMELICLPCRLSYGACLIIALAVAKDSQQINLSVDQDAI